MTQVITKYLSIRNGLVRVNGETVFAYENDDGFKKFIRSVYKHFNTDYAKFFKMDPLSKLGFLSIDILLTGENILDRHPVEKSGIILLNGSSSLEVDEKHYDSIRKREQYFPSPSNFVYTLPNIMAGEAAIRHGIRGENSVLISDAFDEKLLYDITSMAFTTNSLTSCACGWVEQYGNTYESCIFLVEEKRSDDRKQKSGEDVIFEAENLSKIYKQEKEWKN